MNHEQRRDYEAAVAAGDSAVITRIENERAAASDARRVSREASYAREALALAPLVEEIDVVLDSVAAYRHASGVVQTPHLTIHHETAPLYSLLEQLRHEIRDHWKPTVVPLAARLANPPALPKEPA